MTSHVVRQVIALVVLCWGASSGCVTNYLSERDITHPNNVTPSPGARAAPGKWEGPWKEYSSASALRATFYYGPWQCNRQWMASCQRECAELGRRLMGCMWLADIKYDWRGPVMPLEAGSRYALYHCCCDFPTLKPADKEPLRKQWENAREGLRRKFADIYGEWPKSGNTHWPGHHMRDLWHGGNPTDLGNVMPAQPDIHGVYNEEYPRCYEGRPPWNTVEADLPNIDR
ncbi:hypothetical protein [Archangium lipolyticum]|uniref:hypothetical protein n=1 Tax=Archangium lipolyticum TaxID=2970465 RepID=UPI00214A85CF|nr:hypothetical protein [Archangium lipolyticum]